MAAFELKRDKLLDQLGKKIAKVEVERVGPENCLIFNGKIRPVDGYCYLTYTYYGRLTSCTVAKAQWLVKNKKCPLMDIPDNYHVSHLCHNNNCINKDHLVLEPGWVNLSRKRCISGRQCIGHEPYLQCKLDCRFVYSHTHNLYKSYN